MNVSLIATKRTTEDYISLVLVLGLGTLCNGIATWALLPTECVTRLVSNTNGIVMLIKIPCTFDKQNIPSCPLIASYMTWVLLLPSTLTGALSPHVRPESFGRTDSGLFSRGAALLLLCVALE